MKNLGEKKENKKDVAKLIYIAVISTMILGLIIFIIVAIMKVTVFKVDVEVNSEETRVQKLNLETGLCVDKPIIYIYPEKEIEVTVELENKEKITCSYPKYEDKWEVMANPNGDLKSVKDGKNLYSLYYESETEINTNMDEGFCIKGEDSIEFLEEKLKILGLSDTEMQEFIIYWLPQLENNKYNYIRFASQEEIEDNMKLNITPKPTTEIRVWMIFSSLEEKIEVKEQRLEQKARSGYTVVEWGGVEI